MKTRLTKLFTVLLTAMLVVGMTPATGSAAYAASWNSGSSFSSWFSGLFGGSSNESTESVKETESNDLANTFAVTNDASDATSNDTSGTADDIVLKKTATDKGTDDKGNQLFDINLSVEGKEITTSKKVDIVLILDASSSMTSALQTMTKNAAKTFVNKIFADTGVDARVAVVSYGETSCARNYSGSDWTFYGDDFSSNNYSNNKDAIIGAIDKAYTVRNGNATNTEGAFLVAKELTSSGITRSGVEHLTVFMTDGVPTQHYYTKGWGRLDTTGGGTYTNKDDYNEALTAAIDLGKVSNVYNVALTGGLSKYPYDNLIAEKFMDQPPYEMTRDSYDDSYTPTFSSTASAVYAKKYYNIATTNENDASTQMQDIYSEIASQALSLVKDGVVTDTLPAEFKLTEAGKQVLTEAGATFTENTDGTTTITYTNVPATKDVTNLATISVKYVGNGYGAAYTNTSATYSGILYNGTEFTKEFQKPVAGLHPKTVEDSDSTSVGTQITVDVKGNDQFEELTVDGYTVSDYEIVLTDKDGNTVEYKDDFTATIVDGKLQFTSTTAGTKELYYVVKADITKTDANFAENGQTALISRPTKVTIDVYDAANKAFVVDFGKPVTYSADDVFTESEQKATITLPDGSGTYGNMALNSDKSITYKLKKFMDGIDVFTFNEVFSDKVTLDKTVSMIPATSIYYDDSFTAKDGNGIVDGITYTGDWKVVEKEDIGYQDSAQGTDANYGYDSSENIIGNSEGTVHYIDGTNTSAANASITFKGTGIDIYSYVNNQTGKIAVRLYDENGTALKTKSITTTYQSGELYQVPTITFKDLDYGKYTVKITITKGKIFYLDGLRIYNPSNDAVVEDKYKDDNEYGAKVIYLRDVLAGTNEKGVITKAEGTVFIDEYVKSDKTVVNAHNLAVDSSNPAEEYVNYGCKQAETNIPAGESIKVTLDSSYSNVQVGLKTSSEGAKYQINGGTTKDLLSSTDMYYKVTLNDDNTFTITNCSDVMIQITSIKAIK